MKILIFSLTYPNEYNQMANIFTYEQAKTLAEFNDVTVAFVQMLPTRMLFHKKRKGIQEYFDGVTKVYSIQMHTVKESILSGLNGIIYREKAVKLLEHIITTVGKPDVIYAHFSIFTGWAATYVSQKYSIPLVVQEHDGSIISKKLDKFRIKCLTESYLKSDRFISVSENLKNSVEKQTGTHRDSVVIGNMVDPVFHYIPREKKDDFVFLGIGNLYSGKRFDLLIQAFYKAFADNNHVKLRICGDGDCREQLCELVNRLEMKDRITIVGRVNREDTLSEYSYCDVFVLPSNHETFGIVYREALVVGRPIITTNHGGFERGELFENEGIMIPVDNESALVDALNRIYRNIDKYDSEKISEMGRKHYSPEIIINSVLNELNKAISDKG